MINQGSINQIIGMFKDGSFTPSVYIRQLLKICVSGAKNLFLDTISETLPVALSVAGAILVVTLGWKLFRTFTRG